MLLLKLRCGILLRGGGGVGGISAGAAVLLQAPPLAKVGDEDEDEQQQYEEEKEADDHSEAFVQLRVIGVVPSVFWATPVCTPTKTTSSSHDLLGF